ncbi:MAG: hypothetical protein WC623_22320 [Pedobacter sp.]
MNINMIVMKTATILKIYLHVSKFPTSMERQKNRTMTCNLGLTDVCQRLPILGCEECPNSSTFNDDKKRYRNTRDKNQSKNNRFGKPPNEIVKT